MRLLTDIEEIKQYMALVDNQYFVNQVSSVCLPKLIEMTFRDKYGNPLRLLPFQQVLLHMFWNKKFPMVLMPRGGGKTYMLAVYALLKAMIIPGSKIVIASGTFRQSKFVLQYVEEILRDSPILQETIRKFHSGNDYGVKYAADKAYIKIGTNSLITAIPLGDGSKVRGLRATTLIVDEVASVEDRVFDSAIGPFLSSASDPTEAVLVEEFIKRLERLNAKPSVIKIIREAQRTKGNQLILSGTAHYQFNHFYRRYQAYHLFATSGGDKQKIKEGLRVQAGELKIEITDDMLETWSKIYKEYAIFQLPYNGIPAGFLDASIVATHKATMSPIVFGQEYECKFSKDTTGFFPRSIIDEASPGKDHVDEVHYELYGDPHAQYVMGLDPARWNDNFGLVILKLEGGAARCVYVESWNKIKFQDSLARIRNVMRRFPNIVYIAMDKGGGGDTMQELLANAKMLKDDERPIVEIEPADEYKSIPNALRILDMVNFHTWSVPANHALRSDIVLKKILFPSRVDDDIIMHRHAKILKGAPFDIDNNHDVGLMEHINDLLYGTENKNGEVLTLGSVREYQGMIDELCTIIQTVTDKGNETFGLQKVGEQPEGLDIRRRDRYSALLMAAYAARQITGHGHKRYSPTMGGSPNMIISSPGLNKYGFQPMQRKGGIVY